jgi:L-lactate dehydrogenase complex protein LldG
MENGIAEARNSHILVSGPSATGDMGTLVQGVHGPEELDVVVLEGT